MAIPKYIIQGLWEESNHQDVLTEFFSKKYDNTYIYSAFLRSESVDDLKELLINNNGHIFALVGIRNGVTTKQGLEEKLYL